MAPARPGPPWLNPPPSPHRRGGNAASRVAGDGAHSSTQGAHDRPARLARRDGQGGRHHSLPPEVRTSKPARGERCSDTPPGFPAHPRTPGQEASLAGDAGLRLAGSWRRRSGRRSRVWVGEWNGEGKGRGGGISGARSGQTDPLASFESRTDRGAWWGLVRTPQIVLSISRRYALSARPAIFPGSSPGRLHQSPARAWLVSRRWGKKIPHSTFALGSGPALEADRKLAIAAGAPRPVRGDRGVMMTAGPGFGQQPCPCSRGPCSERATALD